MVRFQDHAQYKDNFNRENVALRVQKNKCNQCLFTKNKIVSDRRKKDIVKTCISDRTHFVCHKNQTIEDGKDELVCRGYYNKHGHHSQMIRICERIGAIHFVSVG